MIIPGYNEVEYMDRLCDFIRAIDLAALSEAERELIFSEPLKRDPVSRKVQKFMI